MILLHTPLPVSRWICEVRNNCFDERVARAVVTVIGGVASRESGEFWVVLFAGKWRHDKSEGYRFLNSSRVTNEEDRIRYLLIRKHATYH
ncbi:hypothetical protein TNCV_4792281 [Trichonephila clavipes]|nr:hypothetical protein TNCV_4792281 [Trichonephila clavipes]